jgi:hypothetical protein
MTKISRSPERHTFQKQAYIDRMTQENKSVDESYLGIWETEAEAKAKREADPEWQKDNLEYDLRTTDWILDKVRNSKSYAQNLYAAMCNNDFQRAEMWPILTDKTWGCSWRSAGGIVADMRQEGDYIDWYCSGIRNDTGHDPSLNLFYPNDYVSESVVTEEIESDLAQLGWIVIRGDSSII